MNSPQSGPIRTERYRRLHAPLTPEQLAPLPDSCSLVILAGAFNPSDLERIARFLSVYPQVALVARARGASPPFVETDLAWLARFPALRRLWIDLPNLRDLAGLEHVRSELEELRLGAAGRPLSLSPLRHLRNLRALSLDGPVEDFDAVGAIRELRDLELHGFTLPDLSPLPPLLALRELKIHDGAIGSLSGAESLRSLEKLEVVFVEGLSDLTALARLSALRDLTLAHLRSVASLPSLAALERLRRVRLEGLELLRDLSPVASARNLEEIELVGLPLLSVEGVRPLVGHGTLRTALVLMESEQQSDDLTRALGLPMPSGNYILQIL
jgi:Leucine-rich repeat (LRR) protein